MTIDGETRDHAEETSVDLYPNELIVAEKKYKQGMITIDEIYKFVLSEFKKQKIQYDSFYVGWRTITCTWLDSESSESS
jgi:hypothetical protein